MIMTIWTLEDTAFAEFWFQASPASNRVFLADTGSGGVGTSISLTTFPSLLHSCTHTKTYYMTRNIREYLIYSRGHVKTPA